MIPLRKSGQQINGHENTELSLLDMPPCLQTFLSSISSVFFFWSPPRCVVSLRRVLEAALSAAALSSSSMDACWDFKITLKWSAAPPKNREWRNNFIFFSFPLPQRGSIQNRKSKRCLELVESNESEFGYELAVQKCSGQKWTITSVLPGGTL